MRVTRYSFTSIAIVLLVLTSAPTFAQTTLSPDLTTKIDAIAAGALAKSGVPSASIAVVREGKLEQYIVSSAD